MPREMKPPAPLRLLLVAVLWVVGPSGALAGPGASDDGEPAAVPTPDAVKSQAKERFQRGLQLMKATRYNDALAEFLTSRDLYPTRGNTQNAAVCLRELGRYDEALAMFETLLKDFDKLSSAEQKNVREEITSLRSKVGHVEILVLEPDAEVLIDGRSRGKTPLSAPLRVSEGGHVVRIYKPGFAQLEVRVEVEARKTTTVDDTMKKLTRSGQLKVATAGGEVAEVLIDGVVVGETPWEGMLAVGKHSVALRGEEELGTAPIATKVTEDELTTLRLELVALEAELRVQPVPVNAAVAIDGVDLGRGIWDGRVAAGHHVVEVAAEGFLPHKQKVSLERGQRETLRIELERDPESELWADKQRGRVTFDLHLAPALAPLMGGDLAETCTGSCSGGLGVGGLAMLHGGYRFGMGIGLTLDAGYLLLVQSFADRPATLTPRGLPPNVGTLDDDVMLMGLLVGGSGSYQVGDTFPFQVRVGGGVFFGSLQDERSGTFTTTQQPVDYGVGPLTESPTMSYAFVSPELRIGYRFADAAIVSLSAQGLFMFALSQPEWSDEQPVLAGSCDGTAPLQCDGEALFGPQALAGDTIIAVSPGIALALEL